MALVFTAGRKAGRRQPGKLLALAVLGILGVEALHPETEGALAAAATVTMYLAILAPIFWVPRLAIDPSWFRRVVLMIWAFQSLSALVGALQVYYPGTFQPAISTILSEDYASSLHITLASGESILRPMGLTDTPGGAAGAGTYAVLLALGLWTSQPAPSRSLRVLLATSIGVGMFALYLCQIRALVVMVGLSVLAIAAALIASGRIRNLTRVISIVGVIAVGSFVAAVSVGGEAVTGRLSTLVESTPTDVYYTNRGIFLEHTLTELLPQYPLGAGLGRWGMIASYFGGSRPNSSFIWAEIQWTGWLLDGGVALMIVYGALIASTLVGVWRIALGHTRQMTALSSWAVMLVGYDVGTIALTLNFPVFMSSFGLDFWLLNAALFALANEHVAPGSAFALREPSRAAANARP